MATEFGKQLKALISVHYKSQRLFVEAAEGADRVETGQPYVSQVIAGKKPPPLDRLDAWADALKLEGVERDRFWDLATIAHLPEVVRGRFERILLRIEAVEKQRK